MTELIYHMIRYVADVYSFDPEILSGEVATLQHGIPPQKLIRECEVLLTDFGRMAPEHLKEKEMQEIFKYKTSCI